VKAIAGVDASDAWSPCLAAARIAVVGDRTAAGVGRPDQHRISSGPRSKCGRPAIVDLRVDAMDRDPSPLAAAD